MGTFKNVFIVFEDNIPSEDNIWYITDNEKIATQQTEILFNQKRDTGKTPYYTKVFVGIDIDNSNSTTNR